MKIRKLTALAVVLAGGSRFASAQALDLAVFLQQTSVQTGSTTSTLPDYVAFERVDTMGTPSDPKNVSVQSPNGTAHALPAVNSFQDLYQSSYYSTLSAFTSVWGTGNYTFSATGGLTGVVNNPGVEFTPSPALVTNYAALTSGLSSVNPFTVTFTAWTPNPLLLQSSTFVSLYDVSTGSSYVDGTDLSASATSWTIAAGDLLPNNKYLLVIDDDSSSFGAPQAGFQDAFPYLSYDVNEQVYFQTVPEPAPVAVVGLGVLGFLIRRRR